MGRQSKITRSARGEDCLVRIPNVCSFDNETVVYAHLGGAGMGVKSNDLRGAYCCARCHDAIDGRAKTEYSKDELLLMHYEGVARTQIKLLNKELIVLK